MKKGQHKDNKIMAMVDMAPFARRKKIEFYFKNISLYSYFLDAFPAFIQFAGTLYYSVVSAHYYILKLIYEFCSQSCET